MVAVAAPVVKLCEVNGEISGYICSNRSEGVTNGEIMRDQPDGVVVATTNCIEVIVLQRVGRGIY